MNYELPLDYESLFRDKLVIITGAGRSGTTLLGKIIGSMQPSYFLFEPTIMKLIFAVPDKLVPMLLFEDYILPKIQGQNLNLNEADDSCEFNYRDKESIWSSPRTRVDAIQFIEEKKPVFIIKITEGVPLYDRMVKIFSGVRFIDIVRNGNDVISSSLKRDWFADGYKSVEIFTDGCPWYIDEGSRKAWPKWNPATRAACIWRCSANPHYMRYEDLVLRPEFYASEIAEVLGLGITELTKKHFADIHKAPSYPSILDSIQEPEKTKYVAAMKKLGYQI